MSHASCKPALKTGITMLLFTVNKAQEISTPGGRQFLPSRGSNNTEGRVVVAELGHTMEMNFIETAGMHTGRPSPFLSNPAHLVTQWHDTLTRPFPNVARQILKGGGSRKGQDQADQTAQNSNIEWCTYQAIWVRTIFAHQDEGVLGSSRPISLSRGGNYSGC